MGSLTELRDILNLNNLKEGELVAITIDGVEHVFNKEKLVVTIKQGLKAGSEPRSTRAAKARAAKVKVNPAKIPRCKK